MIRPLNYPKGVPGIGYTILQAGNGEKVAVVNLLGRVFMPQVDCPFQRFDEILEEVSKETRNVIVRITSYNVCYTKLLRKNKPGA